MPKNKILIIAYSVNPYRGSEAGVGWNFTSRLGKYFDVTVIYGSNYYKFDSKELLEKYLIHNPICNVNYIHIAPSRMAKILMKMHSIGIWYLFYPAYRLWHKKAYQYAKTHLDMSSYSIIHQLNMIGYREPGYFWKFDNKYIWGPIGGHTQIPVKYLPSLGFRDGTVYMMRNIINYFQMKCNLRVKKAAFKASILLAATKDDYISLLKYHHKSSIIMPETSAIRPVHNVRIKSWIKSQELQIIWCGNFEPLKALPIALNTLQKLQSKIKYKLHIIGDGRCRDHWVKMAYDLGINNYCKWYGNLTNIEVHKIMNDCHVFLFTSIKEATPWVILEALSNALPIITHNIGAIPEIISDHEGFKVEPLGPSYSINSFVDIFHNIVKNPPIIEKISRNNYDKYNSLSWDQKITKLKELYMTSLETE